MFLGLRKLGNICCGHKMFFLNKIRNIFCVPDTKFVSATNVARAGKWGDICVGNNVSTTMCSRLPGPLHSNCYFILNNIDKKDILCRLTCITCQKLFAIFWVKHFSDSICVAVSLLHEHNLLCDKLKEHILTPSLDKGVNRSFLSVLPRATFLIFNGTNMVACNFVHFAANGIKGLLVATGNGASFPWQQHKLNVGHQIFIVPYSTDI